MSELHALLIGIDDYFPGRLPDGGRYPSLQGATRDIERMESLLRDRAGLQSERTWTLLSRAGEDGGPAEPPERRPTYENIVAALKRLAGEANPRDRVYIHYTGHGARLPTEFPGAKGLAAKDEALVPCDIGDPGSRYLKDVELSLLLRLLAERGLAVTAVLDCCHSGGVMRTGHAPPEGAVPRRVQWISRRSVPSAVVDPRTLFEARQKLRRDPRAFRGLALEGWLPAARYEVFAACRPDELAFEYPFENREPQGALTSWLLDILKRSGGELRCGEVHQELIARVHGFFAYQTPVFLGDPDRGFLAERSRRAPEVPFVESPMVLRIGEDGRVLINVGVAAGAQVGGRALWKGGRAQEPATELVIDQVGATESWAQPKGVMKGIEPGARIEVLGYRAGVRLVPPPPGDPAAQQAFDVLASALRAPRRGSIAEICEEDGAADLSVTVGESGTYEILDPEGAPFPNLEPLRIDAPGAARKALQRLDHLARFRRVLTAENLCPPDWLGIRLELDGGGPEAVPEPLPCRGLVLRCGEARKIRIVNRSKIRLDIAALDLAPDYSVTQILPQRRSVSLVPLDPEQEEVVSLRGWLPRGWNEGTDVLKIFATQGTASFRCLELPPIGCPPNPLRGGLTPSSYSHEEWITTQVEIQVRR